MLLLGNKHYVTLNYTTMYFDLLRRQLNDDSEGSGGSTEFIPLGDIDAELPDEKPADKLKPLETELDKPSDDKPADDAGKPDDKPKPADKGKPTDEAPKDDEKPTDNTSEDDTEPEGTFWDDVNKLRGEDLEVDFGDVNPESPEGALIYEKAVREDELNKFEDSLKQLNPRAYAFLTHILDGKKEEEFFKIAGDPATLPTDAELEVNVDLQKDIITRNLKAKGNSDKVINAFIKSAVTDDELEETAKEALKEEITRQAASLRAVEEASAKQNQERQAKIKEMNDYVGQVATSGKLDGIIIPEKDRAAFAKAVTESIRFNDGKFSMVTELTNENLMQAFKEKFFSFKKGNLEGLIEKQAKTENTRRLQRTIPNTQKKPLANGKQGDTGNFVSLGDLDD